ncbi:hypothetical protein DFA_00894 [Cavenderia fasciculata]|uniref:Uncharacterized protein n=1 Tax=Cavenderia fasciculata TaxID=261658 RepID=F4PUF3_CACFS|nr:uncharacterized protein DFA_00894 [Cavenderia fasciculata]EGG21025.1 hypothetical protein DFA_00894 [Cavenderia fasciculata]|eukprot:XP_004358875.1 hypothetical protein DFA_00894 [Cavenderia fasciculata]
MNKCKVKTDYRSHHRVFYGFRRDYPGQLTGVLSQEEYCQILSKINTYTFTEIPKIIILFLVLMVVGIVLVFVGISKFYWFLVGIGFGLAIASIIVMALIQHSFHQTYLRKLYLIIKEINNTLGPRSITFNVRIKHKSKTSNKKSKLYLEIEYPQIPIQVIYTTSSASISSTQLVDPNQNNQNHNTTNQTNYQQHSNNNPTMMNVPYQLQRAVPVMVGVGYPSPSQQTPVIVYHPPYQQQHPYQVSATPPQGSYQEYYPPPTFQPGDQHLSQPPPIHHHSS